MRVWGRKDTFGRIIFALCEKCFRETQRGSDFEIKGFLARATARVGLRKRRKAAQKVFKGIPV